MPAMKPTKILEWSDQLATGLADVDQQHQQLIDIVNDLGDLRASAAPLDELSLVLDQLRDYTVYHFQNEADLMQSYPVNATNRNAHLKAHQGFIDIVNHVATKIATNATDVVDQLLAFLVKWLVQHITGMDARLAREILAFRAGPDAGQIDAESNALYDSLINTVSDLYDSLGSRTFEMLELNRQLQSYRELQEEENALAQDIILRLMQRGGLSDSKLMHWALPATTFSGDIAAVIRSPKGLRYAVLADATGHGLAAAITVLPVLTTFGSMAKRDLSLAEIVVELNKNLLLTLPAGRFVAAVLLCIDEKGHTAEVWNGGMPDQLLLSRDGRLLQAINSSQVPLGIANFDASMAVPTKLIVAEGDQFVMYSDGLIEATNPAGEPFGMNRLIRVLTRAPAVRRIAELQEAWRGHVRSALQQDDVSLLLID